jgi:hypothetical protein
MISCGSLLLARGQTKLPGAEAVTRADATNLLETARHQRGTGADPIMQAPFWSQGLNRWSYVFNDPVNLTDPSGFVSTDNANDIAGGVGIAAGNPFSATAIMQPVQGAGASVSLTGLGGIGQVGITALDPQFGARSGGSATVAAPTSAPSSTGEPVDGELCAGE